MIAFLRILLMIYIIILERRWRNRMDRPYQDKYFMDIAKVVATRSNCYRRQVGCVMIDKENRILSTGYNGVPKGVPHCEIGKCPRVHPGQDLDICLATHAEMNALIQCKDPDKIWKIYVTHSPCLPCTVVLLNTNCSIILYGELYPGWEKSKDIWMKQENLWSHYETARYQ
jgi:dCMP deaminase